MAPLGGGVKRSWSPLLGVVLLVLVGALLLAFGVESVVGEPATAVQAGVLTLAGLCFLAAGFRLPEGVRWYHLAGAGDVLLGLSFLVRFVVVALDPGVPTADLAFTALGTLGGLSLAYLGVDIARGGRSLTVDPDERPLA